jgi:hypothetical protein
MSENDTDRLSESLAPDELEVTARMEVETRKPVFDANVDKLRLVALDGSVEFPIEPGINTIGRLSGANMIVIRDEFVSGLHAEISVFDNRIFVKDIGSTNGTYVNGVKVPPACQHEASIGDEITIGHMVMGLEVVANGQ